MNDIPKPDELDDIWFYMNYRLNFYQIFKQENKDRLMQNLISDYVHNKTAPDNAQLCIFLLICNLKFIKK